MSTLTPIKEAVRGILAIAQATLLEHGTHIPTAVVHTLEGLFPVLLPYKDEEQRKALVEYVKSRALESHAYAVTTVTCSRIVDSRTKQESEALVLTTAVQGGQPYVVMVHFTRNENLSVEGFGEVIEGDDAVIPGQMIIFPDWDKEQRH